MSHDSEGFLSPTSSSIAYSVISDLPSHRLELLLGGLTLGSPSPGIVSSICLFRCHKFCDGPRYSTCLHGSHSSISLVSGRTCIEFGESNVEGTSTDNKPLYHTAIADRLTSSYRPIVLHRPPTTRRTTSSATAQHSTKSRSSSTRRATCNEQAEKGRR